MYLCLRPSHMFSCNLFVGDSMNIFVYDKDTSIGKKQYMYTNLKRVAQDVENFNINYLVCFIREIFVFIHSAKMSKKCQSPLPHGL